MHLVWARALALIGRHFFISFLLFTILFMSGNDLQVELYTHLYLQILIEHPLLSGLQSDFSTALFNLCSPSLFITWNDQPVHQRILITLIFHMIGNFIALMKHEGRGT